MMTAQEAIKLINGLKTACSRQEREAIDMAISALEKQMGKNPELYKRSYWCPVCEGHITVGKKYCGNCGQAICWDVTEDEDGK